MSISTRLNIHLFFPKMLILEIEKIRSKGDRGLIVL